MSSTTIENEQITSDHTTHKGPFYLKLFNNEITTWQQVIDYLMKVINCTKDQADLYTSDIDRLGSAIVYQGEKDDCEGKGKKFEEILIRYEVGEF